MWKHFFYWLIPALLATTSCQDATPKQDSGKKELPEFVRKDAEFPTIQVKDVDTEKAFNVEEIIDSVSFIRLSSEKEAILGAIDQIIIHDSLILLRDTYSAKSVKAFSASGQYLNTIGRLGRGPGEYTEPTFMQVIDTLVAVYDQYKQVLLYYRFDGSFVRQREIPFFAMGFHVFNPDQYLFLSVNSDNDRFKSIINYAVFQTDSTLTPQKTGFYRKKDMYLSDLPQRNFFPRNDRVYFHPTYRDTIYSIGKDGTYQVEYAIDFGRKTVPEKLRRANHRKQIREEQANSRYLFMGGNFHLTNDYLHFYYTKSHGICDCIFSKTTGKLVSFGVRNGFYPLHFTHIIGGTEDAFIGYITPGMVKGALEGWKDLEYDKLVQTFGKARTDLGLSMEWGDNPILTFYYPNF